MLEALETSEDTLTSGQSRPAIELRSLSKTYGRGKKSFTAVKSLSVNVAPGEVFGFLGPNGAGKTTTIKMLAGLLLPTSGTALVHGYDVQRQRSLAVQQIGAVLEGSRNIYWSLTAMQNLLYFGRLKGLRSAEIKPRAEQLLTELGLWDRRDQAVGGFSRGMQQKVAIAAALVTNPPVILLDEPTIGLDVEASRTVKQWVVRLAKDEGKTVVLTTHQLAMAEELSDRVAVIRSGEIVADLPIGDLLDRYAENRIEVRLGAPSSQVAAEFPNADLEEAGPGQTSILLPTEDLKALHAALAKAGDAALPLIAVNRVRPSLEQVFVQIVQEK